MPQLKRKPSLALAPVAPLGVTAKQYLSLQQAYDYYNEKLFSAELPQCLVTFQRQRKSLGYYWPEKLISRVDGSKIAEIALAINTFERRDDLQIFSTLVHEMVHHWQQCYGKPSRNGYHNQQWADKMREIGLIPSDTAAPGGKDTGQKVSHYIDDNGLFKRYSEGLAASIDWNSAPDNPAKKAKANKVKYTCPSCNLNVWGKPGLAINCVECDIELESN